MLNVHLLMQFSAGRLRPWSWWSKETMEMEATSGGVQSCDSLLRRYNDSKDKVHGRVTFTGETVFDLADMFCCCHHLGASSEEEDGVVGLVQRRVQGSMSEWFGGS